MPLEAVSSGASTRDEASVPKAQKVDWRVVWAAAAAMLVEGYDLGVYGNLLPFLLKDGTLGMDTTLARWRVPLCSSECCLVVWRPDS